jgi:hypothetical protein
MSNKAKVQDNNYLVSHCYFSFLSLWRYLVDLQHVPPGARHRSICIAVGQFAIRRLPFVCASWNPRREGLTYLSGSENSTLPVIVTVPRLSTNDVTARLVSWRVKLGDQVVAGQAICEIETTKAVSEVTSPSAGYITPLVDNGAAVAVNAPLAIVSNNIEVNRAAVLAEHYSATHSLGVAHCGAGCSPGTQSQAKGRVIGSALRYYQSIG